MHEFGIASEIWESVKRAAAGHGDGAAQVRSITVELGELNLIEDEQLRFWVGALAERDGSPGVELKIAHIQPTVNCRQCGAESQTELTGREPGLFLPPTIGCPRCGSRDVEVTGGREIRVVSAEIDA